jgi:phytoene dehydrogenase-like protein
VGVGIGRFFCGNLLAKAGHVATIFEAQSSVGGYTGGFYRDGFYFERCSFHLYSPSLLNDRLAPVGKSSLMIMAVSPHSWMQQWRKGTRKDYKRIKKQAKDILIKRGESIIPGVSEAIELQDAASPLTYERFTQNTDGACSASCWNPEERFYKNPMSVSVTTPVENLLIGSC